jgi:hypothetical protein
VRRSTATRWDSQPKKSFAASFMHMLNLKLGSSKASVARAAEGQQPEGLAGTGRAYIMEMNY